MDEYIRLDGPVYLFLRGCKSIHRKRTCVSWGMCADATFLRL